MSLVDALRPQLHSEPPSEVEIVPGLLTTVLLGTNSGIPLQAHLRHHVVRITMVPAVEHQNTAVADEVRRLRDEICRRGLKHQDVARAIGVNRRSLSGYTSGEINPQPERLEALRLLARLSRDIEAEYPGRVREIVLSERGGSTLLDALAAGRYAVTAAWRTWVVTLRAPVDISPRAIERKDPIWAAALHALAAGRLSAPARAASVRPAATYEMDPEEAQIFDEDAVERGRSGYR